MLLSRDAGSEKRGMESFNFINSNEAMKSIYRIGLANSIKTLL